MSDGVKKCAKCSKPAVDGVKLKFCSGCGEVGYCCKECQKEDWPTHKKVCKKKHVKKKSEDPHLRSGGPDIPVVWEDQKRINQFGRLNNRMNELEDQVSTYKSKIAGLEDSQSEIECLLDDDACRIRVGELFIDVDNDEAGEYAAEQLEVQKAEREVLLEEIAVIKEEMVVLKGVLYAKFGQSINLETSPKSA